MSTESNLEDYFSMKEKRNGVYDKYLFAPAVTHFLKTAGYLERDIEKVFGVTLPPKSWSPFVRAENKQCILGKIASIRLSSTTSQGT